MKANGKLGYSAGDHTSEQKIIHHSYQPFPSAEWLLFTTTLSPAQPWGTSTCSWWRSGEPLSFLCSHSAGRTPLPPLTWLHFVPPAGLTAASRGAPLACVEWLFAGTVQFILHRLEALCGAAITPGTCLKAIPTTLQSGSMSAWKTAGRGSNWAA